MALLCLLVTLTALSLQQAASLSPEELCVNAHNKLRRIHQDTPDVSWDASLAAGAKQWANRLLSMGSLQHSKGNYGENLFMASGNWGRPIDCAMASLSWYNEEKYWNYQTARGSGGVTGHFTQLVWKGSTKIGVGIASNGKSTYIVARYTPPGNYGGRYKQNVMNRKPGAMTPSEDDLRKSGGTTPTNAPPPPNTDNPRPPRPETGAPPYTQPPRPWTSRPQNCRDVSRKCRWYVHKCRRSSFIRKRCKKTCKLC